MIRLAILYAALEAVALLLFWFEARVAGDAAIRDVSLQTCLAICVSAGLTVTKKVYWVLLDYNRCEACAHWDWWIESATIVVVFVIACGCTRTVADRLRLAGAINSDEDDITPAELPWLLRKSAVYMFALAAGLALTSAVCATLQVSWPAWIQDKPTLLLATVTNFVQGIGLLPQLSLSHRQGYVTPVVLKFLLILGLKGILELVIDISDWLLISDDAFFTSRSEQLHRERLFHGAGIVGFPHFIHAKACEGLVHVL